MDSLPDRTGWTLLSKIEKARRVERLEIAFATSSLLVNKYGRWCPNTKHKIQKNTPNDIEVARMVFIENFTALAFPLPNSFATRTLQKFRHYKYIWQFTHPCHVRIFFRIMSCLKYYIDFDTFFFIHIILTYSCILVVFMLFFVSCFNYFFCIVSSIIMSNWFFFFLSFGVLSYWGKEK